MRPLRPLAVLPGRMPGLGLLRRRRLELARARLRPAARRSGARPVIVIRRWHELRGRFLRPVVALGKFDGVHRGHQKLLGEVRRLSRKRRVPSMALTFDVHPQSLIRPHRVPPLLSTPEEKIRCLAESGIDALFYVKFTPSFARIPAWEFARDYLAGRIGAGMVLAGKNFRFGRNRTGDVEKLERWGKKLGFEFRVVPQIMVGGEPASSTRVRRVIAEGDMAQAARLLGRPYSLEGTVVHGEGRGEGLGAPTANIVPPSKLLPPDGVYLVRASIEGGEAKPAVANLGVSPTFGGGERRLEVHLLDGRGDLYGREISVRFEKGLRPEMVFDSPGGLARQIEKDLQRARRHFGSIG